MNKTSSIVLGAALIAVTGFFLYREHRADQRIRQLTRLIETQGEREAGATPASPKPAAAAAPRTRSVPSEPGWQRVWKQAEQDRAPEDDPAVAKLLAEARAMIERNHLMQPPGDNAFERVRALAARVGEGDDRVLQGMREIRDAYLRLARARLDENRFADAHAMVDRALVAVADDPEALSLRIEIERRTEDARVRELLRAAGAQIDRNHLSRPPGDNAIETLRAVAAIAGADDARVLAGLERVKSKFLELARAGMRAKEFERAQSYVDLALATVPGDTEATALREQVRGAEQTDRAIAHRRAAAPLWEDAPEAAIAVEPSPSAGSSVRAAETAPRAEAPRPVRSGPLDEIPLPFLRTLKRPPDPVVLKGRDLRAMLGKPLERLGLFAWTEGRWSPIPFQVDEMVDEDRYVFEGGKARSDARGTGTLKPQDELVFMADDAGDEGWDLPTPEGAVEGQEIVLADPIDGGRAWAYLFAFPDDRFAKSDRDYVAYDPVREAVVADGYTISYAAGADHIYFEHLSVPPAMGGNGADFMDRLKLRTYVKTVLLFSLTFDEEDWESRVTQYLDGPVRVIRQVENELDFMGFEVAPTIRTNAKYYRFWHEAPSVIRQTVDVPAIASEAWFKLSVDLSAEARGMRYYRPGAEGISPWHVVDGRMTEDEAAVDPAGPPWHLVTGGPGTLLWRVDLPAEIKRATHMLYIDEARSADGPERTEGSIGETGFRLDLMPLVRDRTYFVNLYYMTPPHWRPGQERYYLQMIDDPLVATVSARPLLAYRDPGGLPRNW